MKFINAFALSLLLLLSAHACAEPSQKPASWNLDTANSRVNFVTIKKGNIAESHTFSDVSGSVVAGKASITIKPDSVDSRVPIRNERMREFLFETGLYPSIEIIADVEQVIDNLKPGHSAIVTLPASLSMHGVSEELNLEVRISQLGANTLVVASTQSVLIRAANYNMLEGITKLSSLVNNLPIAETVPVNFSLALTRAK